MTAAAYPVRIEIDEANVDDDESAVRIKDFEVTG